MGAYLFQAQPPGPNIPLPPHVPPVFVLCLPDNMNDQQALALAQQHHFVQGIRYAASKVNPGYLQQTLCHFRMFYITPPPPVLNAQHVQSGAPVGSPVGQMGGNRPDQIDPHSPFQNLGDASLDAAGDAFYGETRDGTWTDLYQGPGGAVEIPRPNYVPQQPSTVPPPPPPPAPQYPV